METRHMQTRNSKIHRRASDTNARTQSGTSHNSDGGPQKQKRRVQLHRSNRTCNAEFMKHVLPMLPRPTMPPAGRLNDE